MNLKVFKIAIYSEIIEEHESEEEVKEDFGEKQVPARDSKKEELPR